MTKKDTMQKKTLGNEKFPIDQRENNNSPEKMEDIFIKTSEEEIYKKNKDEEGGSDQKNEDQDFQEKIKFFEQEKKDFEEKFLRMSADIQNIRRRAEEEKIKARYLGSGDILKLILPVVDTFSRAFDHIPPELEKNTFIEGLQNVQKNFFDTLAQMGVEFFGAEGEDFDEKKHDSLMLDSNTQSGKIAQVFETGVMFQGNIFRHAKVSVGK